jgi:hypothetical protein
VRPGRLAALAFILLALLGGCGDDDEPAGTVATQTVTQTVTATPTAPATTPAESGQRRCPDVVLEPNSGNGAFDITTENVTCE